MKLFARKPKESPAPPPVVEPVAVPVPVKPEPVEDVALKLNLPNIFEFDQDETKAKLASKRRNTEDETASRGAILLVESDDEVSRLLSRLLEHEGYRVTRTTCLAEAKAVLHETTADFLLARRHCVPLNLQTEHVLRDLHTRTTVRIVDDFSELMLGQVIDYESLAQCTLSLTDLLISLLEGANVGARGHAHSVAKYTRLIGQQMGLTRRELDAVTLAAMIHDLGSLETRHNVGAALYSRDELLPAEIKSTLEMLGNIQFPYEITELINAAAAADPDKTSRFAKAAGILRVADAYDSLRRAKDSESRTDDQIFSELRGQAAGTLDPQALESFVHLRKNEQVISAMNIFWAAVLIVDPNADQLQLLKLRLENADFHVETAKTLEDAIHKLRQNNFTLVITEHKLDGRGDGFELLRTMKLDPELRRVPVVFHAVGATDLMKYALELGAEDWLAKPHNVEIMAMKIQRIVARRHSSNDAHSDGVRGQLRDMGIMEMVQILNAGNRSVKITLERGQETGEIALQNGHIINAQAGDLRDEPAALALLDWEDGQFRIAPLRDNPPVTIRTSTDNLLLQICYLRDKRDDPATRGMRP